MKWLIAFGMFMQFISFWLAAPELIGDATLKRLNSFLQKCISNLSMILLTALVLAISVSFSINGIMRGLSYSETGATREEMNSYLITMSISGIIYIIFLIFFKKIKLWLDKRISAPLINKFTYSDSFRRNSLLVGAILFTFGFLIQFIIILLQP